MKPIDLHLINAEAKFKEAINHAFDLGWEANEERIIKLLEAEQLHDPDILECHCGSWREAVALIKGETDINACEPADFSCVNGFSCDKHRMSLEDALEFIKKVNNE